mmetsp:Transcript_4470/g.8244  ORF Transcript_4470/g.8244 Transcript_4470/m.8244 type:complete len:228 (+) Transcript_4470:2444-3127(+)
MSLCTLYFSPLIRSGLMYVVVPTKVECPLVLSFVATPKSEIFTKPLEQTKMFAGFKSRCILLLPPFSPTPCKYANPCKTCSAILATMFSAIVPWWLRKMSYKLPLSMYSWTTCSRFSRRKAVCAETKYGHCWSMLLISSAIILLSAAAVAVFRLMILTAYCFPFVLSLYRTTIPLAPLPSSLSSTRLSGSSTSSGAVCGRGCSPGAGAPSPTLETPVVLIFTPISFR